MNPMLEWILLLLPLLFIYCLISIFDYCKQTCYIAGLVSGTLGCNGLAILLRWMGCCHVVVDLVHYDTKTLYIWFLSYGYATVVVAMSTDAPLMTLWSWSCTILLWFFCCCCNFYSICLCFAANTQAWDHRTSSYGPYWIQNKKWSILWWIKHFDHHKTTSFCLCLCVGVEKIRIAMKMKMRRSWKDQGSLDRFFV